MAEIEAFLDIGDIPTETLLVPELKMDYNLIFCGFQGRAKRAVIIMTPHRTHQYIPRFYLLFPSCKLEKKPPNPQEGA